MAEWLRGDLRDLAYDTLLDSRARDRGYFEPAAVRALLDRHMLGLEDRAQAIWTLLVFEQWHWEHVDALPPALGGADARPAYSLGP